MQCSINELESGYLAVHGCWSHRRPSNISNLHSWPGVCVLRHVLAQLEVPTQLLWSFKVWFSTLYCVQSQPRWFAIELDVLLHQSWSTSQSWYWQQSELDGKLTGCRLLHSHMKCSSDQFALVAQELAWASTFQSQHDQCIIGSIGTCEFYKWNFW